MKEIRIDMAGHLHAQLIIEQPETSCGRIERGIGVRLSGDSTGFVIDFDQLAQAVEKLKKERERRVALRLRGSQ